MTQLTFQPALDPFHAMFRLIRLRHLFGGSGLEIDHARIIDFYLLFPFRIDELRLSRAHQRFKRLSQKYSFLTPYGEQPDSSLLFQRMEPVQITALETLAANSLLDPGALAVRMARSTDLAEPDELAK